MKVVHVEMGHHLYGGARQVAYLLNGLAGAAAGHVLVCTPGSGVAHALRNPAVVVQPLTMRGDLDVGFLFRLFRLLRECRPDLLHLHSRKGDLLAILAARLAGVPVIYSRRVDNPPNWADRVLKFPLCTRIVTISEGILEVLAGAGVDLARLVCIPSAVDTGRYRPGCEGDWLRAELALPAAATLIGVVAQLIPRKGHAVLFRALGQLMPRSDFIVLVFGQGPQEQELKGLSRDLGLENVVRFAGFRTDMEHVLPCLDVIVHPALMEGLGVSLLEGAACAVPIIASRAGGMPEIVHHGENGYLVAPGDSGALALHLDSLLKDAALRQRLGAAGRHIVLERFAVERMVSGNLALYRTLVDT
jgi:glycosyltransferase involved in cell wall biosynthesis